MNRRLENPFLLPVPSIFPVEEFTFTDKYTGQDNGTGFKTRIIVAGDSISFGGVHKPPSIFAMRVFYHLLDISQNNGWSQSITVPVEDLLSPYGMSSKKILTEILV